MTAIAVLAVVFAVGALAGIIAMLRLGIAREESRRSLRGYPDTRSATATRRVLGLYVGVPANVSAPGSPDEPLRAPGGSGVKALPQRRSPRQLPAPRPGTFRGGLR